MVAIFPVSVQLLRRLRHGLLGFGLLRVSGAEALVTRV
jgi:hypothetical protein